MKKKQKVLFKLSIESNETVYEQDIVGPKFWPGTRLPFDRIEGDRVWCIDGSGHRFSVPMDKVLFV